MAYTPYGYRIAEWKAEPDEVESEQVKALFHEYLGGLSLVAAGKKLNIERYRASLGLMLSDKRYIGGDFYPAIIDNELFKQVQEERQKRIDALGRNKNYFEPNKELLSPFWKLLFCEECGSEFQRYLDNGKKLWRCSRYLVRGKITCKSPAFSEDELVNIFTHFISSLDIEELKRKPQKQLPKIEHRYDDPFKQAEYAYSLVSVDDFDYQTKELIRALQNKPDEMTGDYLKSIFKRVYIP